MRKHTSNLIEYTCEICGKKFSKEVKNVVDSLPYCSTSCWGKMKKIKEAAPELLAACKMALRAIDEPDTMSSLVPEALSAAIAKADGK